MKEKLSLKEKIALLRTFTEDEIIDMNENNILERASLISSLIDVTSNYVERTNEN